jgi:two-component system phosphate regulon sensor histidine kinase PhoR
MKRKESIFQEIKKVIKLKTFRFVLFLVVIIGGSGFILAITVDYYYAKGRIWREISSHHLHEAETLFDEINNFLKDKKVLIKRVAYELTWEAETEGEIEKELKKHFYFDKDLQAIALTDEEGRIYASVSKEGRLNMRGESLKEAKSGEVSFKSNYEGGKTFIYSLYKFKKEGKELILLAKFKTDNLFESFISLKTNGSPYIVDSKGLILFHKSKDLVGKKLDLSSKDPLRETILQKKVCDSLSPEDRYVNEKGEKVVAAGMPFTPLGWGVILEYPEEDVLYPLKKVRLDTFLVGLLGFLCAFPIAFLGTFFFVRPLEKLKEGAIRISQGDLDFRLPSVEGDWEIPKLNKAFNEMAENLKRKIEDLEKARREVSEATAKTLKASQEIMGSLEIPVIGEKAAQQALDLFEGDICCIYWFFNNLGDICVGSRKFNEIKKQIAGNHLRGKILQAVRSGGVDEEEVKKVFAEAFKPLGLKSFFVVPISSDGEKVGLMVLGSMEPDLLSSEKTNLLSLLADEVGVKYKNAQFLKRIREAEEKYRTLFEFSESATAVIDEDKTILMVNRKFEEISGYKREEVEGKMKFVEFLPSEEVERLSEYHDLRRVDPEKAPASYEFWFLNKEGERRLMEISVSLIPGTKKSIASLVDITEKRELERKLEAVLKNMADGVIATDEKDKIVLINPVARRMLKEVLGSEPREVLGKKITAVLKDPIFKELYRRKEEKEISTEFCFNTEPIRCYKVILTPLKGEKERIMGRVLTMHDLSQEKRVAKMKSDFVSTVSHELRTPLTAILGFGKTLLREDVSFSEGEKREFVETIVREGERLSRLIEDMLDLSRIEAGRIEFNIKPLNPVPIIKRVVKSLKATTSKHTFTLSIPEDLPRVLADEDRLEQVFLNLIGNAVKYSPEGGEVKISAYAKTKAVEFCVADEGIGMTEEEAEEIFKPFFRTGESQKKMIGGTGLGLPVTKGFVEGMGGKIWVESEKRKGTKFYFEIPKEDSS